MTVLIVGEAPGRRGGNVPLGNAAKRMASIMGMEREEFLALFRTVNLLQEPQEKDGKGSGFDFAKGVIRAAEIERQYRAVPVYLLAGRRVATAFGFTTRNGYGNGVEYFKWFTRGSRLYAVIPHPSGVNRWFNNEVNVKVFRAFLRGLLPTTGYQPKKW